MDQLALFDHNNPFKLFAPQKSRSPDLKRRERAVLKWWNRFSLKFGVKSYRIVVNRDHIHAVVRFHSPRLFIGFLRAVTGTIARGLRVKWRERPATRIATWGKDFKRLVKYLKLNFLEANGFIDYQPERTRRLPHWLKL